MSLLERPRLRSAFVALVFFTLLAGNAWRYAIGYIGFGVLAVLLAGCAIAMLVAQRDRWRISTLPYPLLAFLFLATISIAWSFYPAATGVGLAATWLTTIVAVAVAITYTWRELLAGLGIALRFVLGLSILFELIVAVIVRAPVLPFVPQPGVDYSALPDGIPKLLYWSRNELFEVFDGGRIQGIVGNASLLGFAALIGLIVFALQFADRSVKRRWSGTWFVVSVITLLLVRSATITVAIVAVLLVVAAVLLVRRAPTPRMRAFTYTGILAAIAAAVTLTFVFSRQILALLGKSEDLTGRLGIWDAVISFAQQRTVAGWGWVSYWIPWVAPFNDPAFFRNGVQQTHAHNTWLDVWLQLGIIGLVVLGALVLSTAVRSWSLAVDRPQTEPGLPQLHTAVSLLPLMLLTALLVQSVAESRLLVEFGWAMLVIIAIGTKTPDRPVPVARPS